MHRITQKHTRIYILVVFKNMSFRIKMFRLSMSSSESLIKLKNARVII